MDTTTGAQRIKTNSYGAGKIEDLILRRLMTVIWNIKLSAEDKDHNRGVFTDRYSLRNGSGIVVSPSGAFIRRMKTLM
ncbi:MAG: hypothetical protein R2681_05000 [Pyrinomonadaceae bacterium]